MSLDYIYLQSIRELEQENNVEFPRDVVNAFAMKNFTCDYDVYCDQVYYGAHSVSGIPHLDRYNFFRNYCDVEFSGKETCKKELYKKSIPLPRKAVILNSLDYDNPVELYIKLDKNGDYWCWEMGSNRGFFQPILCLYNLDKVRYFDAWHGDEEKDENGVPFDYIKDREFPFDLNQRNNSKIMWEDDESLS